jgi:hypothetical protein
MPDEPTAKKPVKPTPSQIKALRNLVAGKPMFIHISGRSASGGTSGTMVSLFRRKLIEWAPDQTKVVITDAGREVVQNAG